MKRKDINKKTMHIKRVAIPTVTLILILGQLAACGKAPKVEPNDLLSMINEGRMIEIEIAVPNNYVEADENQLTWIILAALTSNQEMRDSWDETLNIRLSENGKEGCLYVDVLGESEYNNTLRVALHNEAFINLINNPETRELLAKAVEMNYTDISAEDTDKAFYMALNSYFNILPDSKDGEANADDALSRKEFMAMIARSELQVTDDLMADADFIAAVGEDAFNRFAAQEAEYGYLDLGSKSLNNLTYNGTMTRAEAIYMIVNKYFASDLAKVGSLSASFTDCKDGGNIAEQQKFIEDGTEKEYYRSYEMLYATQNADDGCPSKIYNALVVAYNKGLITSETRWDEGITKYEAIKLIADALQKEEGIEKFNIANSQAGQDILDAEAKAEEDELSEARDEEMGYQAEADFADAQNSVDDYIIMYFKDVNGKETEARYAKQQANIRKGPSIQYDVIGQLEINQKIDAIGYVCIEGSEDVALWYVIKTDDGSTQMVNANLMTEKEPGSGTSSGDTGDLSSDWTTWPDEMTDEYGDHYSRSGFVYGDPSTYSYDGWEWFINGQCTRVKAGEITEEEYRGYCKEYSTWQDEVTGNGVQDEYGEPDGEGGLHWG